MPDKQVVLMDYEISKFEDIAHKLLCDFKGYLTTDGADDSKLRMRCNSLCSVLWNNTKCPTSIAYAYETKFPN